MPDLNLLTPEEVERIHDLALARHGGLPGLRDRGALESALSQAAWYEDPVEQAGAYLYFLARSHAFSDGNKRTALVCCLTWLRLHGLSPALTQDDLFDLTLACATGDFSKEHAFAVLRDAVGVARS